LRPIRLAFSGQINAATNATTKNVNLTGIGINPYIQDFNDKMFLLTVAGKHTVLLAIGLNGQAQHLVSIAHLQPYK
jgi:hypothetical protein